MLEAYLLIVARKGRSMELANKLMKMHFIKRIDITQGEYDVIAEVNAKNEGKLDNIVHENIRKLRDVKLVSPLIVRN
ncbi:MAG: Lrp/AsnC ligand binding domain-containing protein [Nanoarchaeota archaeon]